MCACYCMRHNVFNFNMKLINTIAIACALTCVGLGFSSCSTSKTRLPYFEDIAAISDGVLEGDVNYNLTIRPADELYIVVNSVNPTATAVYNLPASNPAKSSELPLMTQVQQLTYIVSPEGNIDFPMLGKIHVEGLTTEQLALQLTERISKDVVDPYVRVELINFHVNVLGEVKTPGTQDVKSQRYSVIDALAAAGDLTEYGERSNVVVVRENDGRKEYHHLNLNDSKSLESPYFYLQQNDWVYVMPNSIRQANSKYNQFNSYKISVISTIVSACSVVASLVIALAIK